MSENFSHQDLRGQSFKGQDLTGADFSHADIRGVNFKGAILKGANFTNAKGGLTKRSYALLMLIIVIISAIAGILTVFSGIWVAWGINWILKNLFKISGPNLVNIVILIASLYFVIYLIIIIIIQIKKYDIWKITMSIIITIVFAGFIAGAFFIAGLIAISQTILLSVIVAGSLAIPHAEVGSFAGAVVRPLTGIIALISFVVAGILAIAMSGEFSQEITGAVSAIIQLILSVYIANKTSKEDPQFETYRKFGIFLFSLFGTNFDDANLTDANFSKANLKYCRFSKETIILRTCFKNAENLKFARFNGTVLENKAVRELLVSGHGNKEQSYTGMKLKGAYLVGANLSGANLTKADLTGATLENANLRNANLSMTQALGINFRGADLTGVCLESWNIDSTTQLDGAKADYVYLKNNENEKERRPASGFFGKGDFVKLFEEALDTVDMILKEEFSLLAFLIAFKHMKKKVELKFDSQLSIKSFENKDGTIIAKIKVPPHVSKEYIQREAGKKIEKINRLFEKAKGQLKSKDQMINHLMKIIELITVITGNPVKIGRIDMRDQKVSVGRDVTGVLNLGKISGNVTNTIQQLPASSDPNKPGLKEFLTKLQELIQNTAGLAEEDKAEALNHVKALAEIGKNPNEKSKSKGILRWFRGLLPELPAAAATVVELKDVIESVAEIFAD